MNEVRYDEMERACIMHFDGGIPWAEAIEKAAEAAREAQRHLFDEDEERTK